MNWKPALATIGMLSAIGLVACDPSSALHSSNSAQRAEQILDPVQKLTLRLMSSGYMRSVDQDGYYLAYRAVPPSTVIIMVRTPPDIDRKMLKEVIRSATGVITRMGKEQFNITGIRVQVDEAPLAGSGL